MVEFSRLTPLSPSSALPPQDYVEAAPKYISGRTSYLRVRLAFHPYPQLIPAFCTRHGFGPPPRYYRGFNLAMGSSPGFGSNPDNTQGITETRPTASPSTPHQRAAQTYGQPDAEASSRPAAQPRLARRQELRRQRCLHLGRALFGLAFASAPELISLNQAA